MAIVFLSFSEYSTPLMQIHFLFLLILIFLGCQRQPRVSPSADPSSLKALAPMGSATHNAEFQRRLTLLNELLDGKSPSALAPEEKARAEQIFDKVPKEAFRAAPIQGPARQMILAEYELAEHRFMEASFLFSSILDRNPKYPRARNGLARCFYFLGNPDRTFAELEVILSNQTSDAEEILDALFLMGAAALESPLVSAKNKQRGLEAWKVYLRIAPKDGPLRARVEEDLKKLSAKPAALLQKPVNFKNPKDRLKAEGLQAFSADDLLLAEAKLKEFLRAVPLDPEAGTFLARIFIRTNRFNEALSIFQNLVQKSPRYVPAWHYKGMVHMMKGDPRQAVLCWERVLELDPSYAKEYQLETRIAVAKSMLKQ